MSVQINAYKLPLNVEDRLTQTVGPGKDLLDLWKRFYILL